MGLSSLNCLETTRTSSTPGYPLVAASETQLLFTGRITFICSKHSSSQVHWLAPFLYWKQECPILVLQIAINYSRFPCCFFPRLKKSCLISHSLEEGRPHFPSITDSYFWYAKKDQRTVCYTKSLRKTSLNHYMLSCLSPVRHSLNNLFFYTIQSIQS